MIVWLGAPTRPYGAYHRTMGRKRTALVFVGAVLALGGCGGTSTTHANHPAPVKTIAVAAPKHVHVIHCKCAWYDNRRARAARSHKQPSR
jgi:hypothetical protein